jgi:hypothetical protein
LSSPAITTTMSPFLMLNLGLNLVFIICLFKTPSETLVSLD